MSEFEIYRPKPIDGFAWANPVGDADREQLNRISGQPITDWIPPSVEFVLSDDRPPTAAQIPDVPWRGQQTLVFRERASELVRPILEPWGQFLELKNKDTSESLWMFNVCTVIDALDEGASEVAYFRDGVRIMMVKRWQLKRSALPDTAVFRIPKTSVLLLSNGVVDRLQALPITGVGFELLWRASSS